MSCDGHIIFLFRIHFKDYFNGLLGKIREGTKFRRAMYSSKHRGSACSDELIPYYIDEQGLRLG